MDIDIKFVVDYFVAEITSHPIQWMLMFFGFILLWRLLKSMYVIGTSSGGIHYVNKERSPMKMDTYYNPFCFELNIQKASYSGIECTLSSEKDSYVLGVWGVPVYHLFEFMNKKWQSLKNAVITRIHDDKFSSKCVCSSDPILLLAGEKKVIEFKPRWDTNISALEPCVSYVRERYPFVAIMVLKKDAGLEQHIVVAMANIVHIPDNLLKLHAQLLGQYVKLSSGPVGAIKKIFLSSPASSDGSDETFDLCLACYHRAISPVFLPCRHACVCSVCFEFCENCPICRSPVAFYFELPDVPKR